MSHSDETRRAYDRVARLYDRLFHDELERKPDDRRRLDMFAAEVGPAAKVCDAGCGPCGHVTRYLCDKGLDAFGIDISPVCIETARKRNPGIPFLTMDMAHLDLPDASLDGIVSFYSVIHAPKRLVPSLFDEFRRVLKPGGILLVVVKRGEGEGYVESLLDIPVRVWFAHFLEDEIRAYFSGGGFILTHLETRMPYDFEIDVPRIYAVGKKIHSGGCR